MRLRIVRRPLIIVVLSLLPVLAWGETVYLSPAEALKTIFHDSKEVVSEKKTLTAEQRKTAESRLGTTLEKETWNFFVAKSGGTIDGYALVDHEIGKTEPISFLTAINPDGTVKAVEVLVFSEPIGGEIHDERFLRQYKGKRLGDPIRIGQDIANISGATMSARAVSHGVKRALSVWKIFYGK